MGRLSTAVACIALVTSPRPTTASTDAPPKLIFQRLTADEGLSHNWVQSILKDSRGFLWFGTQDGLTRYDGASLKVYRHDPLDPRSLPSSVAHAMLEDRRKRLWICSSNLPAVAADAWRAHLSMPSGCDYQGEPDQGPPRERPRGHLYVDRGARGEEAGSGLRRVHPLPRLAQRRAVRGVARADAASQYLGAGQDLQLQFAEGLRLLLEQPRLRETLGRQGRDYVEREYSWEAIDAKMEDLLARTA